MSTGPSDGALTNRLGAESSPYLTQHADNPVHWQPWDDAAIAEEDAFRVQVYSDLARVWYEKLERERNAIENWERVLDIDPGNTYALFSIAEIQRAGGQSRERADTLHRIIDVGAATLEDADLITVYMQLGHIYANELQQPSDAADAYRNVLNVDPAYFEALIRLSQAAAGFEVSPTELGGLRVAPCLPGSMGTLEVTRQCRGACGASAPSI